MRKQKENRIETLDENNFTKSKPVYKQRADRKEEHSNAKSNDLYNFHKIIDLVDNCKDLSEVSQHFSEHIDKIITDYNLKNYQILFLYQPYTMIDEVTVDKFYNAMPKDKTQNILLIINSHGGRVEPAYLISKACKEFSKSFVTSIPRKAKSAATLVALGADEIHMGAMSELGPIDPQFEGLPALAISSALEKLAQLTTKYPMSSDLFANYLTSLLDINVLGYFERVSESTVQYAQRLLKGKNLPYGETIETVAKRFVYSYKDHSFVIDKDEAAQSLGDHIKTDTDEYKLGNEIHNYLDQVNFVTREFKKQNISIVGDSFSIELNDIVL